MERIIHKAPRNHGRKDNPGSLDETRELYSKGSTMILAIGNSACLETEAYVEVKKSVERLGGEMVLFKQNRSLAGEYLTFRVTQNVPSYVAVIDGKEYDIDRFSTIWYMHPVIPKELLHYKQVEFRPFISAQFLDMRKAIWSLLRHKKWLNDPFRAAEAENKILQLSVASKLGFEIPDTIITSDPDKVRGFYYTHHGNIVVKTLALSPILDRVLYTSKVTEDQLENIDSLKLSPSIFQDNIAKEYELRITIVGEEIFPVRIDSQRDVQTAIDWRVKPKINDFEVEMEPCEIPTKISTMIKSFMVLMGLRYGCIDMIVTRDNKYVFLEINPNGQWYFVQLRTGATIAEAIARMLI